jgi:serine protease Do
MDSKKSFKKRKGLVITSFIVTLLVVLSLFSAVSASGSKEASQLELMLSAEGESDPTGINALDIIQDTLRGVAQKALPVVVEIDVVDVVKQPAFHFESPFDFFFGPKEGKPQEEREFRRRGLGSGLIVKRSGKKVFVLTNNHVVGNAEEIMVKLYDKRQYKASLVGKDPRKDLALVEFETDEDIPVAELGNSDLVQVGDLVFAVGNPLGFESTMTMGIVSAVGRKPLAGSSVAGFTDYIQTDAAINRGNSGGPLVNIRGQVIGINTWISSPDGGSIGLGFTIPINNAKQAIEDFISKGSVDYGWLGINISDPAPDLKKEMEIGEIKGGFVFSVFRGSPADAAGILPGDFITRINSEEIDDATSLIFNVANLPVGKTAEFDLIRYGEPLRLSVEISARKEEEEIAEQRKSLWPGMAVLKITEDIQKQLNLPKKMGELIIGNVSRESPAGIGGFQPGDIIKDINGRSIKTVMDFYKTLNDRESRELMFRIYRQGNELLIGLVR